MNTLFSTVIVTTNIGKGEGNNTPLVVREWIENLMRF